MNAYTRYASHADSTIAGHIPAFEYVAYGPTPDAALAATVEACDPFQSALTLTLSEVASRLAFID